MGDDKLRHSCDLVLLCYKVYTFISISLALANAISQKKRKRIEECFGWLKDIALLRKLKHRGLFKVGWIFTLAAAAYNLVRLRNLIPIPAAA